MAITRTLAVTSAATFAVMVGNPSRDSFPTPVGTGFFVSNDGWFVTAAHVLDVFSKDGEEPASTVTLDKEMSATTDGKWLPPRLVQEVRLEHFDRGRNDFALLKADFEANQQKDWLSEASGFPFLTIGSEQLQDGQSVYSFGYPLSKHSVMNQPGISVGTMSLKPRVTSAIIASTRESSGPVTSGGPPLTYVLDKALNYGNSGGPIVSTETGEVHAFCSRFQPVRIEQPHLGKNVYVDIPSLYGVATSLCFPAIRHELETRGIVDSFACSST